MLSGYHFFTPSVYTTLCAALSYLFLLAVPFLIYRQFVRLRSIQSSVLRIAWITVALAYVLLLCIYFPGFFSYDDGVTIVQVMKGQPWAWQSLTYSIFLSVGLMSLGNVGFAPIAFVFLFLIMALKVFKLIDQSGLARNQKNILALLLALLALHPINQGLLLFHSRDALFSLMLIYLGLHFFDRETPGMFKMLGLTLVVILAGDLRQEAKIYLLMIPVLFAMVKKWKMAQVKIFIVAGIVGGVAYYKIIPHYFKINSYEYSYQVTAYVLPLSQIFHDRPWSEISDEHKKNIDAIISIEKLRDKFNPVDIDPFHFGGMRWNALNAENMRAFKQSAHALFLQYPGLFLENRLYLMASMLNLGKRHPLFFADSMRSVQSRFPDYDKFPAPADNPYPLGPYAEKYAHILRVSTDNAYLPAFIFGSFLIPTLFLLGAVVYICQFPLIGAFALLVGVRLPVLFLLAPASYLKYVYSIFVFFTFGFVIFLIQFLERKKQKAAEGPTEPSVEISQA